MSDPFYVARGKVMKIEGVHRAADSFQRLEIFAARVGPIKEYYRIDSKDLPLPVDYIVAATGG